MQNSVKVSIERIIQNVICVAHFPIWYVFLKQDSNSWKGRTGLELVIQSAEQVALNFPATSVFSFPSNPFESFV